MTQGHWMIAYLVAALPSLNSAEGKRLAKVFCACAQVLLDVSGKQCALVDKALQWSEAGTATLQDVVKAANLKMVSDEDSKHRRRFLSKIMYNSLVASTEITPTVHAQWADIIRAEYPEIPYTP